MSDTSPINIGELSKPATVLIEKISDAVGGVTVEGFLNYVREKWDSYIINDQAGLSDDTSKPDVATDKQD